MKHHTVLNWALYKKQVFHLFFLTSTFTVRIIQPLWQEEPSAHLPKRVPKGSSPSQPGQGTHQDHFRTANPSPSSRVCVTAPNTQGKGSVAAQADSFVAGLGVSAGAAVTPSDCPAAAISQEHLSPWVTAKGGKVALVVAFFNHHPHVPQTHAST